MLVDALDRPFPEASNGARWDLVTDQVMGGVSDATLTRELVAGRVANRLRGTVRLENDGGFVQMAIDLVPDGGAVDLSAMSHLTLAVIGNAEIYGVHLRTLDVRRPWQSYRAMFRAEDSWREVALPLATLAPHRIDMPFDARRVRRLGIVAIGRAFTADLAVARVAFDRAD
ncbi:MAG: CIA30 family protein [Paracoccaceae bacterium]